MMVHMRPNRDDDIDDRDIRAFMRESAYQGRMRDDFKRNLLRELNHNFAYHRFRTRMVASVVVVLGALSATSLFRPTDVSSDAFDLNPVGIDVGGQPLMESPNSQFRINLPGRDDPRSEGQMSAEEVYERIKAGFFSLVSVESWTIEDETLVVTTLDVLGDNGRSKRVSNTTTDSDALTTKFYELSTSDSRKVMDLIDAGKIPPEGTDTVDIEGGPLPMDRWTWTDAKFGRIVYHRYVVPKKD